MPKKKNILITDRFSHEALLMLQGQNFLNIEKAKHFDLSQLSEQKKIHGLIIRSRTKIDESFLSLAKDLQVIITCTSGFDHIDLAACEKWGVTVMYTPHANIESALQLTWGLIFSCARNLKPAHQLVAQGEWNRDQIIGTELSNKSIGIVGLGRIGLRVAEIANAFGLNVLAYDPYCDEQNFKEAAAEKCSYEDLLKKSDIVTFHVPKTNETQHMLNAGNMKLLKPGVIVINSSRGSVIHEGDLAHALQSNIIRSCGLDVFEKEPLSKDSALLQFPQVILTPHIGANTTEAFQKASESAALKMIQFFLDGSTSETLPPKAAWYGAQNLYPY